jgi:hypothetical protein
MRASPSERQWVIGFAVTLMLITTIPYLVGFQVAQAHPEWRYSGLLFGTEDGYSYIAKMLLGASGSWVFRSPYTAYPTDGMLAFLPYMLLGKLTAPPGQHAQLIFLFHLFRIIGGMLLILATYDFIAMFIREIRLRRLALALAVVGGGLGWLAILGLNGLWSGALPGMDIPLEFYSPESFGFLMLLGLPHLAAGRALLLWSLLGYLRSHETGQQSWKEKWMPGLLCLMIGTMQPLTIVVEWAILGAHLAATAAWQFVSGRRESNPSSAGWEQWRFYFRRAVYIVLISSPAVVYTYFALRLDPVLSGWEGQNLIVSPPLHHYLLAYGLLLPFVLAGIAPLIRDNPWKGWLITAWAAAFPLLAYAPYSLQRRLPEALWVALVILAVRWIASQTSIIRRWMPKLIGVSFLTTIVLLLGGIISVLNPYTPLFRPADEVRAFVYLAENARVDSIVLASFDTSNAMPAWAPVRVLLGSGPESVNLKTMNSRVACFYRTDCPDSERLALLREFKINYIYWGPDERELGDWDPRSFEVLQPVYQQGTVMILKIQKDSLIK